MKDPVLGYLLELSCRIAAWICLFGLVILAVTIGYGFFSNADLTTLDDQNVEFRTALMGSALIVLVAVTLAGIVGIGAGIYLEEYIRPGIARTVMRRNVNSSLGIPPLLYGFLGLFVFAPYFWSIEASGIFAASLTLAAFMLPATTRSTQNALRSVPKSVRRESYALGATRWQTIRRRVLPIAIPRIARGATLAAVRAIGEAAPLLVLLTWVTKQAESSEKIGEFAVLPVEAFRATQLANHRSPLGMACIITLLIGISAIVLLSQRWSQDDTSKEVVQHG